VNYGEDERDDSKRKSRKSESRETATGKLEGNLKWIVSFAEILETGQREFRLSTNSPYVQETCVVHDSVGTASSADTGVLPKRPGPISDNAAELAENPAQKCPANLITKYSGQYLNMLCRFPNGRQLLHHL
tara:strand:- start:60032 stop:60424 length:393 start_codon:yes stop_codon:yes gene_type:complete